MTPETLKLFFYVIITLYTIGVLYFVRTLIVNKVINKKKKITGYIVLLFFTALLLYPVIYLLLLVMHLLLQII